VKESIIMAAQLASHMSLMAVAQETSFLGASVRPGQVVHHRQSRSLVRRSTTIVSQASKAAEILKRVEQYTTVEKAGITWDGRNVDDACMYVVLLDQQL
jgi:hypothetical protein